MDPRPLSLVADQFQGVFAAPLLNAWGTEAQCCRRQRSLTPFRLGLVLPATGASQRVETSADCHRGFHAVGGTTITYHAFYHQGTTPRFADGPRAMTSRLIGALTLKVRGCA